MSRGKKITGFIHSFFSEQVIGSYPSKINPLLEVALINGRYQLNAGNVNYSFGPLHDAFRKYFKKDPPELSDNSKVLLLGLGAGSVVRILKDELGINCDITGVEIDETVIEIAKEHFELEKIERLNIVIGDATDYVSSRNEIFDTVIIDIYIDDIVPAKFETRDFIREVARCLNPGGKVVFNKLQKVNHDNSSARALTHIFESVFDKVKVYKIAVNKESPNFFITGKME